MPVVVGVTAAAFRLRGRVHKAALTAHVLAAVGWFGAAVTVLAAVLTARWTGDPALAIARHRILAASPWLTIPVLLATAAVLSAFRPRGRTPWGRRRAESGVAGRAQ
jgi:hypothetical protein